MRRFLIFLDDGNTFVRCPPATKGIEIPHGDRLGVDAECHATRLLPRALKHGVYEPLFDVDPSEITCPLPRALKHRVEGTATDHQVP